MKRMGKEKERKKEEKRREKGAILIPTPLSSGGRVQMTSAKCSDFSPYLAVPVNTKSTLSLPLFEVKLWVIAPSYCADVIGASPLSSLRPSCTVQRFPSHLSSAAAAAFKCGWENSFQRRRGCGKKSAAAAGENRVQQGGRGGLGGRTDLWVVDQTSIRVRTSFGL